MHGGIKRLGILVIVLLLLPIIFISAESICKSLLFKPNSYFEWKITLWKIPKAKETTAAVSRYVLWEGHLRLNISVEPLGGGFKLRYDCNMNYTRVISQTYTALDDSPRVYQGMIESASASVVISGAEYIYRLSELKWGFRASFSIIPVTFFNVLKEDFVNWLINNFSVIKIGEIQKSCAIVYDSWDIVLGTYRRVYYAEMFLPARYLNTTEPISVDASMAEFDFTIDKEYGFIGYLRIYWEYSTNESFEIIAKIINTNLFHHNVFYYTVITVLVVLIATAFVYKRYREKRRLRLIRV